MVYEVECNNCEVKFEITIKDYLLADDDPQVVYCPNCGKTTLD